MSDRKRLPPERRSINRKFKIQYVNDQGKPDVLKLYVIAGVYDDGSLGEIFIRADRVGTFLSGALDGVAMMISVGLQHGVPLETITKLLRNQRFEPCGFTGDPEFHSCTSPFDLVAQWLDKMFGAKKEETKAE